MKTLSMLGLNLVNVNKISDYIFGFNIAWWCIYASTNVVMIYFDTKSLAKSIDFLSIEPFGINFSDN